MDKWKRWICTGCKLVVDSRDRPSCCGDVEEFSPLIHGSRLVGLSNSWISVWERWRDHPLMEEARDEVARSGNYGADMVLNTFIKRLVSAVSTEDYLGEDRDDAD